MASPQLSLPEPKLKLSDGTELHMSLGMFNDIMKIVGPNVGEVSRILIEDALTRELIIRRLFTPNQKTVTEESQLIDTHDIEVSPAEISKVLGWVADHTMHFLVSTGQDLKLVMTRYQKALPELVNENPSPQ